MAWDYWALGAAAVIIIVCWLILLTVMTLGLHPYDDPAKEHENEEPETAEDPEREDAD